MQSQQDVQTVKLAWASAQPYATVYLVGKRQHPVRSQSPKRKSMPQSCTIQNRGASCEAMPYRHCSSCS